MIPVLLRSGARLEPAMLAPARSEERPGAPCALHGEEVLLHRNVEACQINSQTLSKVEYSSDDWQKSTSSLTLSNIHEVNNHHT